jgi:hypothetical protein
VRFLPRLGPWQPTRGLFLDLFLDHFFKYPPKPTQIAASRQNKVANFIGAFSPFFFAVILVYFTKLEGCSSTPPQGRDRRNEQQRRLRSVRCGAERSRQVLLGIVAIAVLGIANLAAHVLLGSL